MKAESQETKTRFNFKGTWQRIKKPLLIAFFVLIVLVSYCLYAENTGIFPGSLLNRFTVENYLNEQYPHESFKVAFREYDQVRGRYLYTCSGDQGEFTMAAKRFSVREDGYYRAFLCDQTLSQEAEAVMEEVLLSHWKTLEESTLKVEASMAIPGSEKDSDAAPADLLVKYGNTLQLTATISGNRIEYKDYTECAWQVMKTVRETMSDVRPDFIQIFYYRSEAGNPEGVLQYESHMQGYSLMLSEEAFKDIKNVHYYVEITEEQRESLKWYSIIRIVNFVVIGGTVIGLGTLWLVRRHKKKEKELEKKSQNL